jgi:hypothetical protein
MSGETRSTYGEMRNVYNILVGSPQGKRLLGRCRRTLDDNIKMDLSANGCERGLY